MACVTFPKEHCGSKSNISRHTDYVYMHTWNQVTERNQVKAGKSRELVYMHRNNTLDCKTCVDMKLVSNLPPRAYLWTRLHISSVFVIYYSENCFLFWSEHLVWCCGERSGSIVAEHAVFLQYLNYTNNLPLNSFKELIKTYLFQFLF